MWRGGVPRFMKRDGWVAWFLKVLIDGRDVVCSFISAHHQSSPHRETTTIEAWILVIFLVAVKGLVFEFDQVLDNTTIASVADLPARASS